MVTIISTLKGLIGVFERKHNKNKKTFIYRLASYRRDKGNSIHGIMLNRLNTSLSFLFKLYKNNQERKVVRLFLKWKFLYKNEKYLGAQRKDLEGSVYKKIENKKKLLKEKLVDLDKSNKEVKTSLENEKEKNNNFNKKIKSFTEKEAIFLNKIKGVEDEIKTLRDLVKRVEQDIAIAKEKNSAMEVYIKDLEQSIKTLNDGLADKENDMKTYIHEMNEMLDGFEKIGKFVHNFSRDIYSW
jgi:predicted  nucleic acid-binding Zn-ribbon protein